MAGPCQHTALVPTCLDINPKLQHECRESSHFKPTLPLHPPASNCELASLSSTRRSTRPDSGGSSCSSLQAGPSGMPNSIVIRRIKSCIQRQACPAEATPYMCLATDQAVGMTLPQGAHDAMTAAASAGSASPCRQAGVGHRPKLAANTAWRQRPAAVLLNGRARWRRSTAPASGGGGPAELTAAYSWCESGSSAPLSSPPLILSSRAAQPPSGSPEGRGAVSAVAIAAYAAQIILWTPDRTFRNCQMGAA